MRRRGFTLIETLVVVGIVAVCAAILLPALKKARATAVKVQIVNNLRTIGIALVTYKNDFRGSLPVVSGNYLPGPTPTRWYKGYEGAIVLCQALLAPGDADDLDSDGIPQMGFRTRPGGPVYGPYLLADTFTIKDLGSAQSDGKAMAAPVLCDMFGNPILYFPASPARPNVRIASRGYTPGPTAGKGGGSYVDFSDFSRYDLSDNLGVTPSTGPFGRPTDGQSSTNAQKRVQLMLGDRNMNGIVDANEQEVDEPFLLWSAGADGVFGPEAISGEAADKCDDAVNFVR